MKSKKVSEQVNRCFLCTKEVTVDNGKAVDVGTGEPKRFALKQSGDGFICNECDSITSTEIIRRDWLRRQRNG